MKGEVSLAERLETFRHRSSHSLTSLTDCEKLLIGAHACRKFADVSFYKHAKLQKVDEFKTLASGDDCHRARQICRAQSQHSRTIGISRARADQASALKHAQCFSHGCTTDTELFNELSLRGKMRAWSKLCAQDCFFDLLHDTLIRTNVLDAGERQSTSLLLAGRRTRPDARCSGEKVTRVLRRWICEEEFGLAGLNQVAPVQNGYVATEMTYDCHIVRYEHQRQIEIRDQATEQVENLRTHRDIEGTHRLVCDQYIWRWTERPSYRNALALATGELVRVSPCCGRWKFNLRK